MTRSGEVKEAVERIYGEKIRFITFAFVGEDGFATYAGFGFMSGDKAEMRALIDRLAAHNGLEPV